ncbi:MAG: hypothetical protein SFH39_00555 [Candidatus Magnetobacterium sp. LHC-1]
MFRRDSNRKEKRYPQFHRALGAKTLLTLALIAMIGGMCLAGAAHAGTVRQTDETTSYYRALQSEQTENNVCDVATHSGHDTPETFVVDMGSNSGTFTFSYNTYRIKDDIVVSYEGKTLYDTDCVGARDSVDLSFSGSSSIIKIAVTPNCAGDKNTAWDFSITAATCPIIRPTLTVIKSGTGSGTVSISPGILTWNGTTGTASYDADTSTSVTLTATPNSGSTFTGWIGDCTGTTSTCTVTISAAKNVTAMFTGSTSSLAQIVGTVSYNGVPEKDATVVLWKADLSMSLGSYKTGNDGRYIIIHDEPLSSHVIKAASSDGSKIYEDTVGSGFTLTWPIKLRNNKNKPLIFVPGIMGSSEIYWSSKDFGWKNNTVKVRLPEKTCSKLLEVFDPNVTTLRSAIRERAVSFREFKELFDKNGFTVFEAPYDWRLSLDEAACNGKTPWEHYLKPVIERAKKLTGYTKVYVVAHSMGGLLTRTYIQSNSYANDIEKFVMLETPNEGSANTYFQWEGGDPKKADSLTTYGLVDTAIGAFTNIYYDTTIDYCNRKLKGNCKALDNKTLKIFTRKFVKGIGNLFPTYEFLKVWVNESTPDTTPATGYVNSFLNNLNSNSNKGRMIYKGGCSSSDSSCVQTALFMTIDETTADYINVKKCTGLYEG